MPFFNYHKIGATVSSHAQKDTSVAVLRTEVMKEVGDKIHPATMGSFRGSRHLGGNEETRHLFVEPRTNTF